MRYKRHLVQFNDLVFDETDMIIEEGPTTSFKTIDQPYTFIHGSYSPNKSQGVLAASGSVLFNLLLRMKKLPCEARRFYRRWAMAQLTKPGRLWAVQDDTLVWAWAKLANIREDVTARKDTASFDVEMTLTEGIWHKADKQRTFLIPYDRCEFMDCIGYKEVDPCFQNDCCSCEGQTDNGLDDCLCCCDGAVTREMALCYHKDEIQEFYGCDVPYRIKYDCNAAENIFFSDFMGKDYLGQKFCDDEGLIVGRYYSDTDLPTGITRITVHGHVKDVYIEINGNGNRILGEYDGFLTIYENGTVTFGNDCLYCSTVDVGAWEVPEGMDYGWTIYPGSNRVVVQTNVCCGTVCVYIETDPITI